MPVDKRDRICNHLIRAAISLPSPLEDVRFLLVYAANGKPTSSAQACPIQGYGISKS